MKQQTFMSRQSDHLLDAITVGIAEVDRASRCVFVNRAGATLLQSEPAALIGQLVQTMIGRGDQHAVPLLDHLGVGRHPHTVLLCSDGATVTLDLDVAPRPGGGAILTLHPIDDQPVRYGEQHHLATFEHAPVGIAHVAADGRWLLVNARLCQITGYSEAELHARTFQDITYPDDLAADLAYIDQLLHGELSSYSMEKRYIRKDGGIVWVDLTVSLVRAADGAPDYFISVIEDISERKRTHEAQRFLAHASAVLASSLDYKATLAAVARMAVPFLADICTVHMLEADGSLPPPEIAASDPAKIEAFRNLEQYQPLDPHWEPNPIVTTLRTGEPHLVPRVPLEFSDQIAQDAEHRRLLRLVAPTSFMAVALRNRTSIVGVMAFARTDGVTCYTEHDLEVAEELSHRATLALENADLYAAAQQAQRAAERAAERAARLQRVAAALTSAVTPEQVGEVMLNEGLAALHAQTGTIALLNDDRSMLEVIATVGYDQTVLESWQRFPLDAPVPLATVVQTKAPVFVNSLQARCERYPHLAALQALSGTGALAAIPLTVNGQVVGGIGFAFDQARILDDDDHAMLMSLARLCSQAFERASLYAAEQDAHALAEQAMQREQQRAAHLHGIAEAALVINSSLSLEDMLQAITDQARHLIGAHMAVTSFSMDDNWNQSINSLSLSDKYAAWRAYDAQPDGTGIYSLVCRTNTPLRMTQAELEAHPAWHNFGAAHDKHPPLNGWLAAPLIARDGKNLGLIQLSDKYEGEFTADDETILVQLARLASIGIENARLYQEAQAAVHMRDEFLSVASHELKTPLTSMKLQVQTLLRTVERSDYSSLDLDRIVAKLQGTEQQVRRLTNLVDELLDVSRIAAGRFDLHCEWHDLAAIVRDVVGRFEEEFVRAESALVLDTLAPVEGMWDGFRLEQVVTNLVSNAIKYGAGKPIEISVTEHGDHAQLIVRDHGIGIAAEDLDRIFAPFERAVSSRHYGGLGLGLFIVRQIIEALGGTIRINSAPGAGSTFTVELPRRRPSLDDAARTEIERLHSIRS